MALLDSVKMLPRIYNVGPLTVHRRGPSVQNDHGAWDEPSATPYRLNPVHVHPAAGRALLQLPEADRNAEAIQLYTLERLFVADAGQAADVVEWRDRLYRVMVVEDLERQGDVFLSVATLQETQQP